MEDMKEATLRGESSNTPYDIYETVYYEQRGSLKRRRKASHTHKSLADLREKEIQLLNGRIESLQTENMLQRRETRRLTDHTNSFFSKHYPSMVVPDVSDDEMEDDAEVSGRDEDLDVEGQNDEDDYDDLEDENYIRDYPDMEDRNVEGAMDDE
ncbi:acidic leucine-rich nuclear phosphoprotein 32 family member B-like [Papaver somniferum]|uniref:acidic leucine-rich nuclear phosphoprotein 32 family member B-like n=1 Tax=Papaver somniferum TaxID=3469 RepID=UPI000E6FC36F|nr:acidic leucine-rich nuclear phosphoprotein 32 family member B-like [Papaver somniferum]